MALEKFDVLNRWTGEVAFTAEIETTPDMTRGWKLRLAVAWALAESVPCTSLDLDGVDFTGYVCPIDSSFDDSSFVRSSFVGSSFDGSSFFGSSFFGSRFDGSSFVDIRFADSSFVRSSFVRSSFDGSSFDGSRFVGSTFVGSSFDGSSFFGEEEAKGDCMAIFASAVAEMPGLIAAMKDGRINGSVYTGECACLVGTIANVRGVDAYSLPRDSSRPAERWFMMISKGDKPGDNSPGGYALARAVEWAEEFMEAQA